MKKYRLREEVKKYFLEYQADELTVDEWRVRLGNIKLEALEEVPQRVELNLCDGEYNISKNFICKKDGDFKFEEKDLCEKALNGELYTKDEMIGFATWFSEDSLAIEANLKTYLKSFKNIKSIKITKS